jgi:hypothetical protein
MRPPLPALCGESRAQATANSVSTKSTSLGSWVAARGSKARSAESKASAIRNCAPISFSIKKAELTQQSRRWLSLRPATLPSSPYALLSRAAAVGLSNRWLQLPLFLPSVRLREHSGGVIALKLLLRLYALP